MSGSFVKRDLGEAGALYVKPLGNDRFAHLYATTDPDGGGPIGQTNAIVLSGISYHVSAHPQLSDDGKTIEAFRRRADGWMRYDRIHVSRIGSFNLEPISIATHERVRALVEQACASYLARPQAPAEISAARAEHLRMQIERFEADEKALAAQLTRTRTSLEAKRAELKHIE
ncbi:MAG: hypothetical protein ACJ79H_10690 [Myxococcales bacterium]